jgi:hypothetical protein
MLLKMCFFFIIFTKNQIHFKIAVSKKPRRFSMATLKQKLESIAHVPGAHSNVPGTIAEGMFENIRTLSLDKIK